MFNFRKQGKSGVKILQFEKIQSGRNASIAIEVDGKRYCGILEEIAANFNPPLRKPLSRPLLCSTFADSFMGRSEGEEKIGEITIPQKSPVIYENMEDGYKGFPDPPKELLMKTPKNGKIRRRSSSTPDLFRGPKLNELPLDQSLVLQDHYPSIPPRMPTRQTSGYIEWQRYQAFRSNEADSREYFPVDTAIYGDVQSPHIYAEIGTGNIFHFYPFLYLDQCK